LNDDALPGGGAEGARGHDASSSLDGCTLPYAGRVNGTRFGPDYGHWWFLKAHSSSAAASWSRSGASSKTAYSRCPSRVAEAISVRPALPVYPVFSPSAPSNCVRKPLTL